MFLLDKRRFRSAQAKAAWRRCCMDFRVLAGDLPSGNARLVQAWIEIPRDELQADWELAVNGEEVFKIEPLK